MRVKVNGVEKVNRQDWPDVDFEVTTDDHGLVTRAVCVRADGEACAQGHVGSVTEASGATESGHE